MSMRGVCTIALTPFTEDGNLDEGGIGSLSELYVASGVHGITILGIMGEAHKLSDAERLAVTERYVSVIGGQVPVIVGCSAVATKVVVERARAAEEAGAAAIMVAPPNNVRNLDLVFEHFRRVAEAVSVPVVVQDEPVNTGVVMPAPFVARVVNGVGGVGIRKEVFRMRGVIPSSHVRFPAPALDAETLRELDELVEVLGLGE